MHSCRSVVWGIACPQPTWRLVVILFEYAFTGYRWMHLAHDPSALWGGWIHSHTAMLHLYPEPNWQSSILDHTYAFYLSPQCMLARTTKSCLMCSRNDEASFVTARHGYQIDGGYLGQNQSLLVHRDERRSALSPRRSLGHIVAPCC